MAYYGAISAVERAELTLRYRWPWFEWLWWFTWTNSFGPASDYSPEIISGINQWFLRTIDSRTNTIPSHGMGNTEPMLSFSTGDSKNYNQLWYVTLETFLLSYDGTTDPILYYTWTTDSRFYSGGTITWIFRLPPKVFSGFGWSPKAELCNKTEYICDPTGNGIYDDDVLSWSVQWLYLGNDFTILPTRSVYYGNSQIVDYTKDNFIRESVINATGIIDFNYYTLISPNGASLTWHVVVSSTASDIKNQPFSTIFSHDTEFTWLRLTFGAANLFRAYGGAIYPYLEYQLTFSWDIADRFFTIQWNGRVGEYDVQIVIKKPTVQGTVGSDFTVRF